jgi:hypothetical protein
LHEFAVLLLEQNLPWFRILYTSVILVGNTVTGITPGLQIRRTFVLKLITSANGKEKIR